MTNSNTRLTTSTDLTAPTFSVILRQGQHALGADTVTVASLTGDEPPLLWSEV